MSDTNTNSISLLEWANSGMSAERARHLWDAHVRVFNGDWKGRVIAHCPDALADEVQEAMEFFIGKTDVRVSENGETSILSRGYRHYIGE